MTIPAQRYVGTSVPRVEDRRILTGRTRYVGDLRRVGMLEAAFVRSPLAHGRILSIDAERARAMPGVVAVITAEELNADTAPQKVNLQLEGFKSGVFHPLATDKVRYVGDPVALIVAESRYVAEDARLGVDVEYEPLDPVLTLEDALDPDKPPIFADMGTNIAAQHVKVLGEPEAGFAAADAVVRMSIRTPRVSQAPIEARGGLAEFDTGTRALTYHAATRNPHAVRMTLANILRHPLDRIHVVVPDVGGAFGQKGIPSREDIVVCFAARKLGRPVRWLDDRGENLVSATQGRGESFEIAAAVRRDGTILALDVRAVLDQGSYVTEFPIVLFGTVIRIVLPGAYRIDHIRWDETAIVTNKMSFGSLRGPWANESLMRETIIDAIARELELDPAEVRRRNLIPLEEQPRLTAGGMTLEGASSLDSLECALDAVGYDTLREQQRAARAEGRLLGIGISNYVEPAPGPPDYGAALGFPMPGERAIAYLEPDGDLTVITSQSPHGQGHETTLTQVAATELGVPLERVRIVYGDTRLTPFSSLGTGGSRASSMARGAVLHSTRALREKVLSLAGELLEISPDDLEIEDGKVVPRGVPSQAVPLAQIAATSYFSAPEGEEPGLRSTANYRSGRGGWAGGTHVCVVEVDAETGAVEILRYVVAEDCGRVIHPAIVEGQIRGGVAMGLGIALLEDTGYDENGNPANTLMDYLLPTAMEVPQIEIVHVESEPLDEEDYRGIGEGGTIAAPPAIVNAIADAIGGIASLELPLTPNRVLDLIEASR